MVRCRISGLFLGSFMAQRALSWIGTQHVHGTQQPIRTLETVVGMMKSGNTQIFVWFEEGDLLKDWLWVKIPTAWHLEILPLGNRTWQYLALESSLSAEDFPNFPVIHAEIWIYQVREPDGTAEPYPNLPWPPCLAWLANAGRFVACFKGRLSRAQMDQLMCPVQSPVVCYLSWASFKGGVFLCISGIWE